MYEIYIIGKKGLTNSYLAHPTFNKDVLKEKYKEEHFKDLVYIINMKTGHVHVKQPGEKRWK